MIPYLACSADNHVDEPEDDLLVRVPTHLRDLGPRTDAVGGRRIRIVPGLGTLDLDLADQFAANATADEMRREFRNDASGGRDIAIRRESQQSDGVGAEVLFPNRFLSLPCHPSAPFQVAMSRVYNDYMFETFGHLPEVFVPVPILPIADIDATVREIVRCAERGAKGAFMPPVVPWLPYFLADYEPVWRALAETGLVALFHVFGGNIAYGADFANVMAIPSESLNDGRVRVRDAGYDRTGMEPTFLGLAHTVMGMASGMSPLLHLTASGVFERHEDLRFAIVESEVGWLPFVLDAMDHNQDRRPEIRSLDLRASDYFRRQGSVTVSFETLTSETVSRIGAERIMWANDYPHDEGTFPDSLSKIDAIVGAFDSITASAILWGNAARLFGLPSAPPRPSTDLVGNG